ncbi:MAG: MFS transporter [Pseudomonadota bacterium]
MTLTSDPKPVSTGTAAAYAAPNLALAALNFPIFVYLAPFYASERGLSLEALGLILVSARLLDAISDPLMGILSDRWTTRFGRRKLWLVLSTPLVCFTVWQAMVPPAEVDVLYVAFWLSALTLSWTMALTPYLAWGGEIATDYGGRSKVTVWRESAFLIGTLASAAIYAQNGGGADGLRAVALFVVVALPVFAVVAVWWTPEPRDRSRNRVSYSEGLAALKSNGPFQRLLFAYFVNGAANALPAALFFFFTAQVLEASTATAANLLALYFVCAVVAAPVWGFLAKRWSKHRAWCVSMLYSCVIFAFVPFLGPGDIAAFTVICVLTGFAFGADISLPPAIQADVVDVDTAATGEQRTGLYFAFWSVATKAAGAIAAGVGLYLLGASGFQEEGGSGETALLALALLYAAVPVVLKLLATAMVWRFPIDEAAQEDLRRRIEAAGALRP